MRSINQPAQVGPPHHIDSLTAKVREVEERSGDRPREAGDVASGWGPSLARGAVHEWFVGGDGPSRLFIPPTTILTDLARRAADDETAGGWVVWVGKRVWPYARALADRHGVSMGLLLRSVFIDPPADGDRLWAIDLALRNRAVACVVGDGSRLRMPESRRLQLAASSGRALGLLARPAHERSQLSASRTRWRITPEVTPAQIQQDGPRWVVELLRDKGGRRSVGSSGMEARRWSVRQDHETGDVSLVASTRHRSGAPARASARRTA